VWIVQKWARFDLKWVWSENFCVLRVRAIISLAPPNLQYLPTPMYILQWLGNYLYNRQQFITGTFGRSSGIDSGPPTFHYLLALCFLADLSPGTRLVLYADDMLVYRPIRCTQDLVDFQSDTDKIGHYNCIVMEIFNG